MGLHPTVCEHVPFLMSSLTKRLLALDTCVYLFFVVNYYMHFQVSCLTKWLLTFWASVGLFSTVSEFVPPQWPCFTKRLLTFWTIVGFYSTVIICLFKCLAWPKDFWHSEQTSITSWLSIWLAILLLSKSLELDWSGLGMLSTAQWCVLNWTYLNFPLDSIATFSFSKFTFKWGLSGIFYDYKYL